MAAWIAQRECSVCEFAGPETEFVALVSVPGTIALVHRDDAPEGARLICCGCAAEMGRALPEVAQDAIAGLMARAHVGVGA